MVFFYFLLTRVQRVTRMRLTRRMVAGARARAVLVGVLVVLLPLVVLVVAGALANGRRWLEMHSTS
jgi:hypothetical protein